MCPRWKFDFPYNFWLAEVIDWISYWTSELRFSILDFKLNSWQVPKQFQTSTSKIGNKSRQGSVEICNKSLHTYRNKLGKGIYKWIRPNMVRKGCWRPSQNSSNEFDLSRIWIQYDRMENIIQEIVLCQEMSHKSVTIAIRWHYHRNICFLCIVEKPVDAESERGKYAIA